MILLDRSLKRKVDTLIYIIVFISYKYALYEFPFYNTRMIEFTLGEKT